METTTTFLTGLASYAASLDWSYIITLILLCYGINHWKARTFFLATTGRKTRTRYRVLLVGILYGMLLYWLRGYDRSHIENLFQSFLFAGMFHKFILDALVRLAGKWFVTYQNFQSHSDDEHPCA